MGKRFDDVFSALMLAAAVAVVIAGAWCLSHSIARASQDRPPYMGQAPVQAETTAPAPKALPTPTPAPDPYDPAIPLSVELQAVLREACAEHGVPVELALGVIQVESCFELDAVSPEGCYGLMQLNPKYFPAGLPPEDNLRAGIGHLGRLLERYGDAAAALTAYNAGHDTGGRTYAEAVQEAAERWEVEK